MPYTPPTHAAPAASKSRAYSNDTSSTLRFSPGGLPLPRRHRRSITRPAPVLADNDATTPDVSGPRPTDSEVLSPDSSDSDHNENRSGFKPSLKAAMSAPAINSPKPIRRLPRHADVSGPRPIDSEVLSPDLSDSDHNENKSGFKSNLKSAASAPVQGSRPPRTHRVVFQESLESVVLFDAHDRPLDISSAGDNTQPGSQGTLRQDVGQPPAETPEIVDSQKPENDTSLQAQPPPIMPDTEQTPASTVIQEQPSLNSSSLPKQIAAEAGLVPGFGELAESLATVIEATETSRVNRAQWRLLQRRCAMVVRIASTQVKNNGQENYQGLENLTSMLRNTLDAIAAQARRYSQMSQVTEFLQYEAISQDIKRLFGTLDLCLADFSYPESAAQLQWLEPFRVIQEQELASLSRIREKLLEGSKDLEHSKVDQVRLANKRSEKLRSKGMSAQQMFECLTRHGCQDLTEKVDMGTISVHAVATGAYGDIFKGRLDGSMDVAIKVWSFRRADAAPEKCLKGAMRELYHWSKVDHINVQKLLGVVMFKDRLGMVSQWMGNGNMQDYILRHESVDRYQLCVQSAKAVQHLHEEGMVHGDLKACNFLVSSDCVVKLTDFDHSIISCNSLVFSQTTTLGGGTMRWMAPELVMDDGEAELRSTHADIYALGMTMLEIITGAVPYFECQGDNQVFCKLSAKVLPKRTEHFQEVRGQQLWELLERCWDYDPTLRPSAGQVVNSLLSLISATALP